MNLLRALFGPPVPTLRPAEVSDRLKGPQPPFLLDVRQPDEYQAGHIPGASLIPLNQLPQRMGELPQGRDIICVCRSGARSARAARQLLAAGYPAANLEGGMLAWQGAGLPVKPGRGR